MERYVVEIWEGEYEKICIEVTLSIEWMLCAVRQSGVNRWLKSHVIGDDLET